VFFLLASILVSAVWSNVQVYAQSRATDDLPSKSISPQLKAIVCDSSNPDLKVVNTTEARICGIPKTVKPGLPSATPPTSPISSSPNPATTNLKSIATKPAATTTTMATGITVAPKPQQIATKNINAISPSTVYVTWATISLLSNTSSLPSSTIAPQINAVSQQQQSPLIPIARVNSTTGSNGTAGQNYTFAATSPIPSTSDQLIYLGYHGGTKSSHGNDDSKHDDSSVSKRSTTRSTSDSSSKDKESKLSTTPRIKTISTDFDSTKKKTSSGTKVDNANDDPKPPKPRSIKSTSDSTSTANKKTSRNDDGSSEDKSKSDSKLPRIKIIAADNHSTVKKKKSTITNDESSSEDKKSPNTESSSDHVADSLKKRTKLDTTDTIINDDVGSKGDGDSATKLSGHHARRSSSSAGTDHDSIEKNIVPPTSDDSSSNKDKSSHSDDGSESSLSDLGSTIRNKVHSIIRDSLGESGHSLFGFSDNGGF
jgi:hypothetical protein